MTEVGISQVPTANNIVFLCSTMLPSLDPSLDSGYGSLFHPLSLCFWFCGVLNSKSLSSKQKKKTELLENFILNTQVLEGKKTPRDLSPWKIRISIINITEDSKSW
jgi:hypothetical protein